MPSEPTGDAMKRRSRARYEPIKGRRREAQKPKDRDAPKAVARSNSTSPAKETEVARLTRELNEVQEQQTAASEMLRVISSSPADLQPVFGAILNNAERICDVIGGAICRWDGNALHHLAIRWPRPAFAELMMRTPIHPNPKTNVGRMLTTKAEVQSPTLQPSQPTLSNANQESSQPLKLGVYGRFSLSQC